MSSALTKPQKAALKWLKNRGGDGVFDKTQCLIAAGERAGVMRGTWSILERAGMIERYANNRRVKMTDQGNLENLSGVNESECTEMEPM